jgi:Uma2 family endonuclease
MQWTDVMADRCLKDLPYKIELDEKGRIVMSPASNQHGKLQAKTVQLLARLLNAGEIVTECSVGTHVGVKVADVAWLSPNFSVRHGNATPYPEAPDLCVEVLSPSNSPEEMTEKIRLYLGYGAREVWLVEDDGRIRAFGPEGERTQSVLLGMAIPAL